MQSIRNFFHTDKWWGRIITIILVYIFYWSIFYGAWLIIPNQHPDNNTDFWSNVFLVYIFIIVPLISFYIPHFIKKLFNINNIFLYCLHIFLIILSAGLFFVIAAISALSNFQML